MIMSLGTMVMSQGLIFLALSTPTLHHLLTPLPRG